jgi:hypothetical protein
MASRNAVRPDHRGWRIHAYRTIAHGDRGAVGQCRRSSNGRSPSRRAWPLRPGPRRWRAGRKRWLALRVAGPRPVTLPAGLAAPSGRCKDHGAHWVVTASWVYERTWNCHHAQVHPTLVKERTECDDVGTRGDEPAFQEFGRPAGPGPAACSPGRRRGAAFRITVKKHPVTQDRNSRLSDALTP